MKTTNELIELFLKQSYSIESDIDINDDNIDLEIFGYEIQGNLLIITFSYKPDWSQFRRTGKIEEYLLDYITFIYNNK
jgi:hypothetical protein